MENKDLMRALLWAAAVFFAWQFVAGLIWPPPPPRAPDAVSGSGPSAPIAGAESGSGSGGGASDSDGSAPGASAKSGAAGIASGGAMESADGLRVVGGAEESVVLGRVDENGVGYFPFQVTLTSVGAGVSDSLLSGFAQTVAKDSPAYRLTQSAMDVDGRTFNSFATETVHLIGLNKSAVLADQPWQLESSGERSAVFSVEIHDNDQPLIRLRKTFSIPEGQTPENLRHDLNVDLEVACLSEAAQTVVISGRGAVGVQREDLRFENRSLFIGVRDQGAVEVSRTMFGSATEVTSVWSSASDAALEWSAIGNKYFAAFEAPLAEAGHKGVDWVAEVLEAPLPPGKEGHAQATSRTVTIPIVVKPEAAARMFSTAVYLGPKSRTAFQEVEAYRARDYDEQVLASYSMGMCSFLTFRSLTGFMISTLNFFQSIVVNYGVAIIMLVLIVRAMLHPITRKGQVNMMRMQQQMSKIQPKMEEIKKRYPNDKSRQSQEVMKIYQEAGVNPAGQMMSGCLPMFLQMPVWIALYTSLNFNIDMRHQPFLLWIQDLTSPDALIKFDNAINIPLLSSMTGPIHSFNLLPILVSAAMFAQQKLMPKPKQPEGQKSEAAEQAAQMQKIMPFMTLFFGLIFYNMPSGLNLYIGTSSFFGMLEQMHIRRHIEDLKTRPEPEKKKRKMPGFIQKIQKAAEDAQKIQSNKSKSQDGKHDGKHDGGSGKSKKRR